MKSEKIKKINTRYTGGAAMLVTVIFFLFLSTTVVLGVASPILKHSMIARDNIVSQKSYYLSAAALEDAVYRLKTGKNVSSGDTITLNSQTASINLTTTMNGKIVDTSSSIDGIFRKMQSELVISSGAAFNYGIQAGTGGFILNGGSQINGNVYSNGSIVATNGVTITGSAIAADSPALSADQVNDSPTTPPNSMVFRNSSATEDLAQSFQVLTASPLNTISFYMKKVGSPSDATVRIVSDSGGLPSTNNILSAQGTLSASNVGTSYSWVNVVLPSNPELEPGVTYWVVIDSSSRSSSNYYIIAANSAYGSGEAKIGKYSGTWNNTSPSGLDAYFKIYLGGLLSSIGGSTYVGGVQIGTSAADLAWANSVQGASVSGPLFCQTGTHNNKSCNTSRSNPPPIGYPISDAAIDAWKAEAAAGNLISGNYNVGWAGATLGPAHITGNLVVNGGGTLTLSGTIWVEGTVTVSGGGEIKLSPLYSSRSGVLVTDGYISLSGGGNLTGSGFNDSYLLLLTTSDCPAGPSCGGNNALTLSGGAGAVILVAQNGTMYLSGGVQATAATAKQITATGGTTINYDSGVADMNFSSGPSGGWEIESWKEVP